MANVLKEKVSSVGGLEIEIRTDDLSACNGWSSRSDHR